MKIQDIVNSVSQPKEFNGVMQIGFTLKKDPKKWYNVQGEEGPLNELIKSVVVKGAEISFEYDEITKVLGEITLKNMPEKAEKNWADDMTNFEDLLSVAHQKFGDRLEIRTFLLKDGEGDRMVNFKGKEAVFKARVTVWSDKNPEFKQVFEAHGDAQGITNTVIQPHFMRMAETRAIARALRFATNNAKVSVEETDEVEESEEEMQKP